MKNVILLLFLLATSLYANIGKISAFSGDVKIDRNTKLLNATVGFILEQKDTVKTSDNAKAQIVFEDGTVISIGKNAILNINEFVNDTTNPKNSKVDVKFAEGAFKTITGGIGKVAPDRFKLQTKSASIGIRGTIVYGDQSLIACTQGEIEVEAGGVRQILPAGTMTKIQSDGTPTNPEPIEDEDLGDIGDDVGEQNPDGGGTGDGGGTAGDEMEIEPLPTEGEGQQPISDTPNPTLDNTQNTDNILQTTNNDNTKDNFQEIVNNQEPNNTPILPSVYTLSGYLINYYYDYDNNSTKEFKTDSTVTITPEDFEDDDTINALLYSSYLNQSKNLAYNTASTPYNNGSLINLYLGDTYNTKITADNKGEFVTITRNYSTNDYPFTDVKTLGYYGKTPTMSALETNKIYTYTGYGEFILPDGQYGSGDLSLSDSLNQTVYLNSTNKSIFVDNNIYVTQYIIGDDNDIPYGSEFNILKLNNDGSITGKYFTSEDFSDGYNSSGYGDLTGSLYGSELQGLGFTSNNGTNLRNFEYDSTYKQINSAYLDTISSTTTTGTLSMTGYLSGFGSYYNKGQNGYAPSGTSIKINNEFTFDINETTGVITANNTLGSTTPSGNTSSLTMGSSGYSYYIDQDRFGSLFDTYDLYLPVLGASPSDDVYNLDTGWFFSIPDSYDSTSNTLSYNLDDDTSWGYWTATLFKDGSNSDYIYNVNNMSTWIAGIETASSAIPTSGSATFSGHILGSVQQNFGMYETLPILMNSVNSISAAVNLGSVNHNIIGQLTFQDGNENIWKAMFGGTGDNNGFQGLDNISDAANSDIININGSLNAKFYGDGAVKTLGGNFAIEGDYDGGSYTESYKASGVFKAGVQ
ncbi:MAG: FecR family protein [Campylobacterota bacterium]